MSATAIQIWSTRERSSAPVTVFKSVNVKNGAKPLKVISIAELFELHTTDQSLQSITTELRSLKQTDKAKYKDQRRGQVTPFVIGQWSGRGQLEIAVPLFAFDIDGGSESTYQQHFAKAHQSPYIYHFEQSLGGGVRLYIWASFEETHRKAAYLAISTHLSEIFGLPLASKKDEEREHIDTGPIDNTRMWFSAYTPLDLVYHNEDSQVFIYEAPTNTQPATKDYGKDYERGGQKYAVTFTEDEKALDIIQQIVASRQDITAGRNDVWFPKILLPLAHHFGEAGRRYAHDLSQYHKDYTAAETDQEFNEALKKDRGAVTIGSFLHYARTCGITYDAQRIIASRKRIAPVQQTPKAKALKSELMTNGLKIISPTLIEEKEMPEPNLEENGFIIQEGRYRFKVNKKSWQNVSNFVIKPLHLLRDEKQPKRILELTNVFEESTVICCPVKAMSSNTEFAALVEGRGNFVPSWVRDQFAAIKEYIYQYEDAAEEISVLGTQADTGYYAFANGVFDGKAFYKINEYGIAIVGDQRYYLPAFSKVNEDAAQEYHNERKFIFQDGKTTFASWSKQLTKVFGQNAIAGICFVVASAFRDIIFSHANSFPMLFLFGPKGTGKTTYRHALHRLFGNYGPNDAIGLGSASSPKGFARKLAQVRNGLQPFEEYKNKIDPKLIEMLKNIYDGIGYERAQTSNDNRTHATLINSSVVLGGQEMPTKENALFSRMIMLTFSSVKFSAAEKTAFAELEKSISGGLGNVLLEVLQHRQIISETFRTEYAVIYGHLRKDPETQNMEERTLSNVAVLLAPFKILSTALDFPFDYKEAYRFIRESIKVQQRQMNKTNEVNQFWQVLDALEGQKFINQTHYQVNDGVLSLNMKRTYPYILRASQQAESQHAR